MKSVAIHALLAVAGLLAAYQTWTRGEEQEPPPGETTVVQCERSELVRFAMMGRNRNVIVEPRQLDGESAYWITVENIIEKKKARESASETETEKQITRQGFLGNQAFDEYMKWIAPLRAVRSLGKATREQIDGFGLDKIESTLELSCGKQKHTVEVGGWTYGRGDRYAREKKSGQVYLIPASVVRDLVSASLKFMRKQLHDFKTSEVDEARVEAQAAERKLLHRNRQSARSAMWVDSAASDRRNRLYDNWFEQVARLKANAYLPVGAEPGSELEQKSGEVEELLSVQYLQAGKPLGSMRLVRVNADKEYYYALTEKTHAWVEVSRSIAAPVARDSAMVVGKQEPPAESSAESSTIKGPAAARPPAASPPSAHPRSPGL